MDILNDEFGMADVSPPRAHTPPSGVVEVPSPVPDSNQRRE